MKKKKQKSIWDRLGKAGRKFKKEVGRVHLGKVSWTPLKVKKGWER